jgi:hypothetical protein
VRDELWAGSYAAFVLGRLGDFTAASTLAALLEEVDAPSNWSEAAAEHVATTLRAQSDAMAPTVTDVSDRRRFEIAVDGAVLGFTEYRRRPGVISSSTPRSTRRTRVRAWEHCSSKPRSASQVRGGHPPRRSDERWTVPAYLVRHAAGTKGRNRISDFSSIATSL